ncbi:hypothetical protein FQR65_LT16478 [Abscondita terminalis]|nr:hypothetical protein FQR65_LT16478 [Abscondita terminalis]
MNHNTSLNLVLTDKQTGEEWECSYDATYIETLTRKTGNFKQFKIFVAMLKSGLLKTSECITLDLFTYKDLESERLRKIKSNIKVKNNVDSNRRYLVVTYSVEFDKIKYPLPLDYCGPPDPSILQATIRKLESELNKAQTELKERNLSNNKKYLKALTKRVDELMEENHNLSEEVRRLTKLLNKNPRNQVEVLQKAINQLEKSIKCERSSHHKLVEKLQNDKTQLSKKLENVKSSEKLLKAKLNSLSQNRLNSTHKNKFDVTADNARHRQKQELNSKTSKRGNICRQSRSASPRIIHTDQNANKKRLKTKLVSRTRSNSLSSKKGSVSDLLYHLHENDPTSFCESRLSPISRSDSLSTLSYNSFGNSLSKTNNSRSSRYTHNVKSLENHIHKLISNYI